MARKPDAAASRRNPRTQPEATLAELQAMADTTLAMVPSGKAPAAAAWMPPITELASVTTARLLPTRYSDSVLTRIAASDDDLKAIYALDNATNDRLHAESGSGLQLDREELALDGSYARIVNAAFAHPHPLGARFSTPYRGAWYAAFELATAKAEVLFHRAVQLEEIAWDRPEVLDYDHYGAEFSGPFHDLRLAAEEPDAAARAACLDPASYAASQALVAALLGAGSQGVVYPSARRPGGVCLACFRPRGVRSVRKRELHRLTWYPDQPSTFRRVPRA